MGKIFRFLRALYIKTSKGYTPKGTGNNKKDIDSSHTIKRNLLLRSDYHNNFNLRKEVSHDSQGLYQC